jgi:competence protein ComEA
MSMGRLTWPLTGLVAAIMLAGIWWLGQSGGAEPATPAPLLALSQPTAALGLAATPEPTPAASPTPQILAVYVSGAVRKAGVYRLPEGSRVDDALRAAGGPAADADVVRVNLAARLADEQQIYVPVQGEAAAPVPLVSGGSAAAAPAAGDGKININTAGVAELDGLPRIGPATAQRIIDYRSANGPFAAIEDIQNVKGIGPATFSDLQDKITVK